MEHVWDIAERLFRATPKSFVARLNRYVLQPVNTLGRGRDVSELVTLLEDEECFIVLPEEVGGHCYPPSGSQKRMPWHPAASWRLTALDLRSRDEFDAGHLSTSVHLNSKKLQGRSP